MRRTRPSDQEKSWPRLVHPTPGQQEAGNVSTSDRNHLPSAHSPRCCSSCAFATGVSLFAADACPNNTSEISTDRPDVTNSSVVVPYGSLEVENGVRLDGSSRRPTSSAAPDPRLRLGVDQCTEVLADAPNLRRFAQPPPSSGFSDVVVSLKRQFPAPFRFERSIISATGRSRDFRPAPAKISGRGYQSLYSAAVVVDLSTDDWSAAAVCSPSAGSRASQREMIRPLARRLSLGNADLRIQHADFVRRVRRRMSDHATTDVRCSTALGSVAFHESTQQLDFDAGFGLNSSSVPITFSASDIRSASTASSENQQTSSVTTSQRASPGLCRSGKTDRRAPRWSGYFRQPPPVCSARFLPRRLHSPRSDYDTGNDTVFAHSETLPWWLSGQGNFVFQWHPRFHAEYSGPNSFEHASEQAASEVTTLYARSRLVADARSGRRCRKCRRQRAESDPRAGRFPQRWTRSEVPV